MLVRKGTVTAVTARVSLSMATIVLLASSASVVGISAIARDREEMPHSDIQLVLRVGSSDLALDGTVTIEFALFNDSDDPIYVYRKMALGGLGGVMLHIEDADGRAVKSPFHFDALPAPPKADDHYIFVRLEPAHFLGGRVSGKVIDLIPRAGRYSVFATYRCPLSMQQFGSDHPEPRTLWLETGVIKSQAITVDVR